MSNSSLYNGQNLDFTGNKNPYGLIQSAGKGTKGTKRKRSNNKRSKRSKKSKRSLSKKSRRSKTKKSSKKIKNILKGGNPIIIGKGDRITVSVEKDGPNFVYKTFEPSVRERLLKEYNIQQIIQNTEEINQFDYVKIPKYEIINTENLNQNTLVIQRIYNINDTDINTPTQITDVLISNEPPLEQKNHVNLDFIKKMVGEDKYGDYIFQLGQLFGILNFLCQIKTDDVEIILGKLEIDGPPKLFIIDFDNCEKYNIDTSLKIIKTNPKLSGQDFDILGRHHVMTLDKLDPDTYNNFSEGYLLSVNTYRPDGLPLANNILANYSKQKYL